ncbi:hypothetical protein D3C73_779030 [compost metagenome]
MRAGRRQGEQGIAGSNLGTVDDFGFFHDADAETGQVVVFTFVHARHFSGFAANQRAARQFAASADAGHNLGSGVDVQFAGCIVVEEEQRLGAAHHQVVDAHGNQVDADAVVLVQVQCQAQLGADAVSAGNQHRLLVAGRDFAEGAETAQAAHDFRARSALGDALDAFDQCFTGVDVYTGVLVAQGGLLAHDPGL